MSLYSLKAIEDLQERYIQKGGRVHLLKEGSVLDGLVVCEGVGLKTAVIKEVYLNGWSSAYSLRRYNKTPKMYIKLIEQQ